MTLQWHNTEDAYCLALSPKVSRARVVWDNNDVCEETLSGKGTTHNTNNILIQQQRTDATVTEKASEDDAPEAEWNEAYGRVFRILDRYLNLSRFYHSFAKTGPDQPTCFT